MTPYSNRPFADFAGELDRFKREVNLTELAASYGYRLVERERSAAGRWRGSTAASISMRNPSTDDKVVIRRDRDGHWTYFSVRDDSDNGTVIDFVQRRRSGGLGGVRRELRTWLREDRPRVPLQLYQPNVRTQARDERAVRTAFESARAGHSRYLAERAISASVQRDPRFRSRFRVDARGNVLFPHCDPSTGQVVGFEAKNRGYTAFATGGRRTFWMSEARRDDDRLVIVEASIDALSYHQVFPHERARYLSTGGALGSEQLALVAAAIAAMPAGADIVSAFDADVGGDKLHEHLVMAAARPLRCHRAPVPKDWNDYLRSLERTRAQSRTSRLER
ncbi:MAG TPA: toprim domain-containing protein [Polyangia bacterium]|nr:toprim domain-containing protein [Polyangia bacterium]